MTMRTELSEIATESGWYFATGRKRHPNTKKFTARIYSEVTEYGEPELGIEWFCGGGGQGLLSV